MAGWTARWTGWARGLAGEAGDYRLASWWFLRLVGVTYLVAFASLWVQVAGLYGARGILPAGEFLDAVGRQVGPVRFWWLPTVFWSGAGDGALRLGCVLGVAASLLVIADLLAAPALAAAWLLYLSFASIGQDFLSFQWDALLLEAGFLAVLLAPPWKRGLRPAFPAPPRAVLLLLHWLLFRLMFSSGAVKLLSGDPTWRDLTALSHHYETQPIPNPVAWFAFQLPGSFHRLSTGGMFIFELGAPLLIFGPRRLKRIAAGGLVFLQILIAVTGNFAFFNLLTLALCVLLIDDEVWPERLRARLGPAADGRRRSRPWPRWLVVPVTAAVLVLTTLTFAVTLDLGGHLPGPALTLLRGASPLRIANGYGLFAVMTTTRPEIVVEGSADGVTWRPYAFRYKPGDLDRRPPFVAPHQPRLDWQMWFAALGGLRREGWFAPFLQRLLEGSPPVLDLLAGNPFPDAPPRYVRAQLYDYSFTDLATLRRNGGWWRREPRGEFTPVVTLDAGGRLVVARPGQTR